MEFAKKLDRGKYMVHFASRGFVHFNHYVYTCTKTENDHKEGKMYEEIIV